jgi:hypothetical protein
VSQQADTFHEAVAPVSIVLALDASGSMTRSAQAVQDAASTFIRSLRPGDSLGVMLFADRAELVSELTTNRDIAGDSVKRYKAGGGTALYDAVGSALDVLSPIDGRRVVVVVSNGRDENAESTGPGSTRTWEAVISQARAVDATVYAIGLGSRVDRARLEQLAALTGGEAYLTSDVTELERQYRRIVEELRRRYVLVYTSTNPALGTGHGELRSRFNQRMLWETRRADRWKHFAGIAAMPSLHVGVSVLFVLVAWQMSRLLGLLLAVYAVAIQIGSVVLAWHYAVDGYLGALFAIGSWTVAGVLSTGAQQGAGKHTDELAG